MTDTFTVLVADDELPAREKIARYLDDEPDVATVYQARDGHQALEVIVSERPDVAFLDIKMPGMDGLRAVESIPSDALPIVVFATAYDEHAVEAFELHATDYLLKPFDRDRFRRTMERIREHLTSDHHAAEARRPRDVLRAIGGGADSGVERLLVDTGATRRLIALRDVERFEANRNYITVHVPPDTYRLRGTITDLEARLPGNMFVRINRSQIVNLEAIVGLTPIGHGDQEIRLRGGTCVRLSRRFKAQLDRLSL